MPRTILSLIRRLLTATGGNVAILFSVSAPLVVCGVSFGVETGYWYYRQASLQGAADAAAYAAGIEARAGSTTNTILSAATAAATANGYSSTNGTITVTGPYVSGSGWAVRVAIVRTEKRYFSQLFTHAPISSGARATASYTTAANACVLALDKSASKAVLFSGGSSLSLAGCDVMSNSIASDSVTAQGSASVTTPCIMSSGGVSLSANVTMTGCSSAMTQLPLAADPYAGTQTPQNPGNCKPGNGNNLQPGCYSGMNLSGNVTLASGVYYVTGDIKINANANVTSASGGVTIYLSGSSSVTINGNATVNLAAQTSGTYAGMLFYGDPNNTASVSIKLNGTASSHLTGALYFPTQDVNYLGNFSGSPPPGDPNSGCTQVVAKTVQWTGNTKISVNCSSYGIKNVPVSSVVKLTG